MHPLCVGLPEDAQGIERYRCPKCCENGVKDPITVEENVFPEKIRKLNKELTEKDKLIQQLKDEKEESKTTVKNLLNENKEGKANIATLTSKCDTLEHTLESKQRNLDSVSNKQTKTKKELVSQQKKVENTEAKLVSLKKENTELSRKIKTVEEENRAFKEFVKDNISLEALQAELDKVQGEKLSLAEQVDEKESTILTLQQRVKNLETPKSIANTQHINNLKTQIDSMENEVGQLQAKNTDLQSSLDVARAELKREKDINTFLVRKGLANCESPAASKAEHNNTNKSDNTRRQQANLVPQLSDASQSATREIETRPENSDVNAKRRDFCVHEFFRSNSCTFPRCMFNHNITDQDRKLDTNKNRMLRKRNEMQSQKQMQSSRQTNDTVKSTAHQHEICETAFHNGPNSCTNTECLLEDQLDYQRIRRGACHFHVRGKCVRGDRCLFSHQIPTSVMNSPTTRQAADTFVQRKHKPTNSHPIKTTGNVNMEHTDVNNSKITATAESQRDLESTISKNTMSATADNYDTGSLSNTHEEEINHNVRNKTDQTEELQNPGQQHQQQKNQNQQDFHQYPSTNYVSYSSADYSQSPLGYYNMHQPPSMTYDPFLFCVRQMIQSQIQQTYTNNLSVQQCQQM